MYEAWKLFYPAKTSEYNKHYFKENQKLVRILKKESIDVPDRLLTARFKGSLLANRMLEKLVLKHQAKAA
jgi:hypothetical protein